MKSAVATARTEPAATRRGADRNRRPQRSESRRVRHDLSVLDGGAEAKATEAKDAGSDEHALSSVPEADLEASLEEGLTSEEETGEASAPEAATEAAAAKGGPPAGDGGAGPPAPAPAESAEPVPTFALPEMPATELSPEEQAARRAELAAAEEAIAQASTAGGVVDAFADAPPSVKAMSQDSVGARIDEVTQTEESEFQAAVPEIHAEMGGTPLGEEEGAPPVEAPPIGEVNLEEETPAPDQQVDLPPLAALPLFQGNAKVLAFFDRLFGGGGGEEDGKEARAKAIGKSLSGVKTKDKDIDTSPGDKPEVALEGETDPDRIAQQKEAGSEQARGARDDAAQAVIDGPGPERSQLLAMDEVRPMGELQRPVVEPVAPADGAARFQALAMPEEVNARFDADLDASMRESVAEARGQVHAAETERDTQREAALAEAETERGSLVEQADKDQRAEVLAARTTIQNERQATLDAQADAVGDLETEAEREDRAQQREIDGEVKKTEKDISGRYDKAEGEADKKLTKGEDDAEAERKKSEEESKNRSWWDRLKSWVKEQFAKLTAAINKIFDAVRAAIKKALDAVRSFAKGLIDLAAKFIKSAIAAFGEVLKGLVNTLLADLFPELAQKLNEKIDAAVEAAQKKVDQAAEDLKAGVDALVDKLQAGLDAILDVFQGALNLALGVLAAALTGDWGEVARLLLEAALKVVGIEPEAFYAFVGKVLDVLGKIIDAPGTFLGNCAEAVGQGIRGFAANFLEYLKEGILKWLTGALGDLTLPKSFNLLGILDLGRQIMGLTWDWLRKKAVKVVGEKNVERLEFLLDYVKTFVQEGWEALFTRVKGELTGLADTILGKIKDFLVEKIIIAGATWIASLFTPVGAVVKLLFTVWNLFVFLRDQISRIGGIIKSVVGAVVDLAQGVIEPAAKRIEGALADALPVAIDLVAALLGVKGVGRKVREVIGGIRERIDKAVDALLERLMKLFKPKPKGEGPEKEEGKEAEEAEAGLEGRKAGVPAAGPITLGEPLLFEGGGESHTLYLNVRGQDATAMMHSPKEMTVKGWLGELSGQVTERAKKKGWTKEETREVRSALKTSKDLLKELDAVADEEVRARIGDVTQLKMGVGESSVERAKKRARSQPAKPAPAPSGKPKKKPTKRQILKKEGVLRDALEKVLVAFGQGPVGISLEKKFSRSIAKIDDSFGFQTHFKDFVLKKNNEKWAFLSWKEIVEQSLATAPVFNKSPFNTGHPIRGNFRRKIDPDLRKRTILKGEEVWKEFKKDPDHKGEPNLKGKFVAKKVLKDVDAFLSNRVLSVVSKEEKATVEKIRRSWFGTVDFDGVVDMLQDALLDALELRLMEHISGKEVHPEVKKIKGSNVVDFLTNMATNQPWGNIQPTDFQGHWANPIDRRHIANAFRSADRRNHEWIAMETTDRVINTARRANTAKSPAAGAVWVAYQNKLRSPTERLIFKPSRKEHLREVSYRNTGDFTPTANKPSAKVSTSKKVQVLQGHPGAVYAPVGDEGYRPDVIDQSKGFMGWHDEFNNSIKKKLTKDEFGLIDIKKVVRQAATHFEDTIWNPKTEGLSKPRFEFYFSGTGKSSTQKDYLFLHKRQTDGYKKELEKLKQPASALLK